MTKTVHLTEGAREQVKIDQAALDALPTDERPEDKRVPAPTVKGRPGTSPSPAARTPRSNLQTPIEPRTPLLVAGGVVAGAGIVTGVVFAVLTGNRADHAEEVRNELSTRWNGERRCPDGDVAKCRDLKDAVLDEIHFSNIAFGSLVAGGAIGVGTLVYGLVTKEPEPPNPVQGTRVTPLIGPGTAGVSLSGRF
ncbi:hypothetical protein [Sorangium sp. So ce124]|uniref:hypothetical protein n=1 Tax=Sorangium sp. So ce124 TaxID=3133280 RepID=UPI003F644F9D